MGIPVLGITIPLSQFPIEAAPEGLVDSSIMEEENAEGSLEKGNKTNLEKVTPDVETSLVKEVSSSKNADMTPTRSSPNKKADSNPKRTANNVAEEVVDDLSDNELIINLNPGIAKRL